MFIFIWWRMTQEIRKKLGTGKTGKKYTQRGSNFRIPGHSFTCHWLRITSIVLCLDLQSLPTHVSEADQNGRVF